MPDSRRTTDARVSASCRRSVSSRSASRSRRAAWTARASRCLVHTRTCSPGHSACLPGLAHRPPRPHLGHARAARPGDALACACGNRMRSIAMVREKSLARLLRLRRLTGRVPGNQASLRLSGTGEAVYGGDPAPPAPAGSDGSTTVRIPPRLNPGQDSLRRPPAAAPGARTRQPAWRSRSSRGSGARARP